MFFRLNENRYINMYNIKDIVKDEEYPQYWTIRMVNGDEYDMISDDTRYHLLKAAGTVIN